MFLLAIVVEAVHPHVFVSPENPTVGKNNLGSKRRLSLQSGAKVPRIPRILLIPNANTSFVFSKA